MTRTAYGLAVDREAYLQRMDELVTTHGVFVTNVVGDHPSESFTYTAGLCLVDHPEFIMFGVQPQLAHELLMDLSNAVLRAGMRFEVGDLVHGLLQDSPALLAEVEDPSEHVLASYSVAHRREHPTDTIAALHVLVPDDAGRLPTDHSYAAPVPPTLGRTPAGLRDQSLPHADERRSQGW